MMVSPETYPASRSPSRNAARSGEGSGLRRPRVRYPIRGILAGGCASTADGAESRLKATELMKDRRLIIRAAGRSLEPARLGGRYCSSSGPPANYIGPAEKRATVDHSM